MSTGADATAGLGWLFFALVTVVCWGLYGVLLHGGQVAMRDAENGRYKAFLLVGVAYFVTAVVAPLAILVSRGAVSGFPSRGVGLSLVAGLTGAAGAFAVLLAFGAKGTPSVVMSIVFAGAPIVNAVVATALAHSFGRVRWPFVLGIFLAATGGCLVTLYRPGPPASPTARP